jgi:hypothetical protein
LMCIISINIASKFVYIDPFITKTVSLKAFLMSMEQSSV